MIWQCPSEDLVQLNVSNSFGYQIQALVIFSISVPVDLAQSTGIDSKFVSLILQALLVYVLAIITYRSRGRFSYHACWPRCYK